MRTSKGGFNASIVNKLFPKARVPKVKTKIGGTAGKSTRSSYKADKKSWKKNVKTAAKATKASARQAKIEKKIDAKLDRAIYGKKAKTNAKLDKRLENLKRVINPNTKLGQKIQEKYNIQDLDKWVADYGKHINGFKPTLKSIFQRSKDKKVNVDFLIKRYIKNPTVNNLTNMEQALSKSMDTTQREAWKAFVKNMSTFLPIGLAASMVVSADD